ncbi:MAG: hypothetical protein WAN66_20815 [Limnoraphis robusta]|uniref:Uncharacterized protein n=2 Tax=Limnoraphis robusta TaxID=1118279 RepID=A0A0F5YKW5_9CYAN|nr:hypothetical protein [Limnoraphis robusta]KKD38825.1 hypothetical protein WN50_06875 [Limnoraphis robusta CS-951]MEA5498932.1 hypothetical protein [Limnoraphis robusta BA-68 BA1]MEA5521837.1 hypothetical protein [Limnoraphis robusta CCNP1315]MEA5540464.1 hypothetical protein [Limnoraphis robusta Tam1]MEA5543967.1 hypothetical protein [Limnoraphis robusta CCNP1324]
MDEQNWQIKQQLVSYFQGLTSESYKLLDILKLSSDILPLETLLPDLSNKLARLKASMIENYKNLNRPQYNGSQAQTELGVGMNSIGMLSDRLSTLIIKEWCLRNKNNPNPEKANDLYQTHTMDIIHALANAKPGSSSMNTKITHHQSDVTAHSWEEAFYGLLSTNIVNWESQEILYIKDITTLPCEELRSYIAWFSSGNIQRNEYIQYCEKFYWR